jgi:hypothetical protein
MKYLEWQKNPIRFLAMTGYTKNEFDELLPFFKTAHDEYLSRYDITGKPRSGERAYSLYSNSPLPCHAERLAFILSYLKLNPIQEQHADTFSMTQKQCQIFVHGLYKILQKAMQLAEAIPASTNQELQEALSKPEASGQNLQALSTAETVPAGSGQALQEVLSAAETVPAGSGQVLQEVLSTAETVPAGSGQELQEVLSAAETVPAGSGQALQEVLSTAETVPASSGQALQAASSTAEAVPAGSGQALQAALSTIDLNDPKILFHDGTEREVPRPVDDELQKDRYSGKKKKHTVKNAVIASACCMIVYVSQTFPGRIHDKTIADSEYTVPPGYTLFQDTGYQGYRPEGVKIIQPKKKPKGKDLTKEEKDANRKISSVRVRVEHAIGGVKRYRIVKDECRLRKNNFVNSAFLFCAALHNFRLKYRPFIYENKLT